MSLVDYASSDEDEEMGDHREAVAAAAAAPRLPHSEQRSATTSSVSDRLSVMQSQSFELTTPPSAQASPSEPTVRLPDASELLGGIGSSSASTSSERTRKRSEANGNANLSPHRKVLHGDFPPTRIPPDTAGGRLVPPQLQGRRNVVTEDLDKLFVRRKKA